MAVIDIEAPLHEAHRDNHTHRDVNGGWLRPAVFGAMDGLVSNLALMTGVAGGAVDPQTIVITRAAGAAQASGGRDGGAGGAVRVAGREAEAGPRGGRAAVEGSGAGTGDTRPR